MKKFLVILLSLVLCPLSLLTGCSNEPPVSVSTEKVLAVKDFLSLTYEGTISPSSELKIFSPVSGNVMEKYIEDDADISERQMLFKVDSLEAHSNFLQAKRELAETMTALAKALVEKDSAAPELQRQVEEKKALVQKLEEESARGIIYAPKAGRLAKIAPLGSPVTENETLLATIGNINPVAVNVELSAAESKILSSSPDLKISLKLNDGTTYPNNGTFKDGAILFENPDELLHFGSAAQVVIDNIKIPNALLINEKAVKNNGAENFVYINKNGNAAVKKIQLGDKLGNYFVVKDGLTADDIVITDGFENLREGSPLNVNDK